FFVLRVPRRLRLQLTRSRSRFFGGAEHQGSRGAAESAEVCSFRVLRAAETSRRLQRSRDMVVCSGRVNVRGVMPASPGRLPGGMSRDPTGRNHIQDERGSGRGTFGFAGNAARPGIDSALSAAPREKK